MSTKHYNFVATGGFGTVPIGERPGPWHSVIHVNYYAVTYFAKDDTF